MSNTQNQKQNTPDQQQEQSPESKSSGTSAEETVKRGEEAIRAQKLTDPKSPGQQERDEKADAEKWRNEG